MRLNLLPKLYLPLLMLLCAAYAWRPLEGGFDFWAHAAVGRWIWYEGQVPRETLFLWSAPGTPWVAHSWLSQLFFYGLIEAGGPLLVVIFNVVMVMLVFFLLWRLWVRQVEINALTPILFALAIWCSAPRFQPRQELISALFLVILLAFLVAWSQGRFDRELKSASKNVLLPIVTPVMATLFMLWVNLHALVAIGLILLTISVVFSAIQDRFNARWRALAVTAILCVAATFVNPYGIHYWEAANLLRPDSMARFVEEWKPFWRAPLLPATYVVMEAILVLMAAWAWAVNPQRRWGHLGWLVVMSLMFLNSRRMLWFLAITALAVLAANARAFETERLWHAWRQFSRQGLGSAPTGLRLLAQAGAVITLGVWVAAAMTRHFETPGDPLRPVAHNVPEGAVLTIQKLELSERIFNDYEHSSYLQWRLNGPIPGTNDVPTGGRYPLYIDLLNAYPDDLLEEYLQIVEEPGARYRIAERRFESFVLGAHHRDKPLYEYLNTSPLWEQVFEDNNSTVWVRSSGPNER